MFEEGWGEGAAGSSRSPPPTDMVKWIVLSVLKGDFGFNYHDQ